MSDTADTFIEVGHYQLFKHGERAGGDSFLSQKLESDGRVISVLSDGLGSGIKAGVLSTLTATMALKFVAQDIPIQRAANIIMNTLPVCSERGISYATFTIVDIEPSSSVRIMEYDNPGYILVRDLATVEPGKQRSAIERRDRQSAPSKEAFLYYSDCQARPGDRLVFFSDGVTQSGMGSASHLLGWGAAGVRDYLLALLGANPAMSARALAHAIVQKAHSHDGYEAKDDISCAVVYFRHPRDLLIMTGPSIDPARDAEMAGFFDAFHGRKIACGGTTASILSRQLGKPVRLNLRKIDSKVPPMSEMEGADLVTEGILTLGRVAEILERGSTRGESAVLEGEGDNGATRIVEMILDSDRILFMVGTKINEAHQDPDMPVELEIRRNIVKKIQNLLVTHYLKDARIRYI